LHRPDDISPTVLDGRDRSTDVKPIGRGIGDGNGHPRADPGAVAIARYRRSLGSLSGHRSNAWSGCRTVRDRAQHELVRYVSAVRTSAVTCVEASWVEPNITCSPTGDQAVAIWIGIDGFSSRLIGVPATRGLVQIGTQASCHDGFAFHDAWHEILPADQHEIRIVTDIEAGDHISARILYAGGRFAMSLFDANTDLAFSLMASAAGASRRSAEWIVEAPAADCPDTCVPIALPRFGAALFTNAHATIGGSRAAIDDDRWTHVKLTMTRRNVVRTRPSALTAGGTSFHVTWVHS
jgi:Peptidase A4 family